VGEVWGKHRVEINIDGAKWQEEEHFLTEAMMKTQTSRIVVIIVVSLLVVLCSGVAQADLAGVQGKISGMGGGGGTMPASSGGGSMGGGSMGGGIGGRSVGGTAYGGNQFSGVQSRISSMRGTTGTGVTTGSSINGMGVNSQFLGVQSRISSVSGASTTLGATAAGLPGSGVSAMSNPNSSLINSATYQQVQAIDQQFGPGRDINAFQSTFGQTFANGDPVWMGAGELCSTLGLPNSSAGNSPFGSGTDATQAAGYVTPANGMSWDNVVQAANTYFNDVYVPTSCDTAADRQTRMLNYLEGQGVVQYLDSTEMQIMANRTAYGTTATTSPGAGNVSTNSIVNPQTQTDTVNAAIAAQNAFGPMADAAAYANNPESFISAAEFAAQVGYGASPEPQPTNNPFAPDGKQVDTSSIGGYVALADGKTVNDVTAAVERYSMDVNAPTTCDSTADKQQRLLNYLEGQGVIRYLSSEELPLVGRQAVNKTATELATGSARVASGSGNAGVQVSTIEFFGGLPGNGGNNVFGEPADSYLGIPATVQLNPAMPQDAIMDAYWNAVSAHSGGGRASCVKTNEVMIQALEDLRLWGYINY